ncbi:MULTISPECIES: hypothetical protein [unclassified Dysgonomonas]|uniref:hypothetical protein n=1 Tax=unclassified Dysgonomonas TaxID=2630389 RepID=UPI0013EB5690|nr:MULTISPECIES: hypothetical protein [unclassified Dysgonomonas]
MPPKNQNKSWSEEDIEKLKELVEGNTPTGVIGLKLGRSRDAIQAKASKEGVSLKPVNKPPYDRKVANAKKKAKK